MPCTNERLAEWRGDELILMSSSRLKVVICCGDANKGNKAIKISKLPSPAQ
jgi:hypothetical protein